MNTNEMTDLEMHLRSWVPRRPSRTVETRLFPRPQPARRVLRRARNAVGLSTLVSRFTWSWATAAAAAALVFVLLHHPHSALAPSKDSPPMLALALSNQAATASLSAAISNEQFSARPESLALTNLRPLTSSFSPRSLTRLTN